MSQTVINPDTWTCPLPLRNYPNIVLGHGGGGKLSAELVDHLFRPAFANDTLNALGDAAALDIALAPGERLAFSTDSFVVRPLFFPGGNIGDLAINGTVNDLAMRGATPRYLSAGFILEEGLSLARLGAIAETMGAAARAAGVNLVTGDTKVVDRGHGDGVYINTAGIGVIPAGVDLLPANIRPDDVVLVSGDIGVHGIAIMSVREGLTFETVIESDCAPLHTLVAGLHQAAPNLRVLRDPTRGGVASALNEIAATAKLGITLTDHALPIPPAVQAACEMLGLDPLYVANEGKLVAIVPPTEADAALAALQAHPLGRQAAAIGRVTSAHPGMVTLTTGIGGTRVVDMQVGEQLPRIC